MNNLDLLPYQHDFVTANDPNLAFIAGVATGKTEGIAFFILRMIAEYPDTDGLLVSNTNSQLINSTLSSLTSVLDRLNIPYQTSLGVRKHIVILGRKILLYSLEKPDTIRGITVGWIVADELAINKSKYAYDVIKTRMRCPKGPLFFRACTTKNGYNWFYDLYASPTRKNNFRVIEAQTKENIFLPPQFLDDLLDDYGSVDSPMYKQEVLNEYVNLTEGSVYYSFDRDSHVKKVKLDKKKHIYLGVDFNIDMLNAIYVQYSNNIFYVSGELHHEESGANTFLLADKLIEDLFDCPYRSVVPDSTGKARKSSSVKSDHQILADAGFKMEHTLNPAIRDRQNSVNRAFAQGRIVIDPSCKFLIKELETLASREKEGEKSHIAVGFGYVVWLLDPLRKKNQKSRSYNL